MNEEKQKKALPKFTFEQFKERFPNEEACLNHLFKIRYSNIAVCPNCNKGFDYIRVVGRRCWQCTQCSHQLYPTAGTILHKSTTPMLTWFHVLYMFCVTRNGVAAKEIERSFDVCYPTALRMAHQFKDLMNSGLGEKFTGKIQMDETFIGGSDTNRHANSKSKGKPKTVVFGMLCDDGTAVSDVVINTDRSTLEPIIKQVVDESATIITDSHNGYFHLNKSFDKHVVINHSKKQYTKDGFTTNGIENYWMHFKRMIKGTHIHVSDKYLHKYCAEHSFRFTHRKTPDKLFDIALNRLMK